MSRALDLIERAIYGLRLSLVALYLAGSAVLLAFLWSLGVEAWHVIQEMTAHHPEEGAAIIGALTVIDGIMVANVVYLIIAGSWEVYVSDTDRTKAHIPHGLTGMTSGLLKEKMASSLMGVSSIYILTQLVRANEHLITWDQFYVVGGFHLLLILGFLVMNYSNRNSTH